MPSAAASNPHPRHVPCELPLQEAVPSRCRRSGGLSRTSKQLAPAWSWGSAASHQQKHRGSRCPETHTVPCAPPIMSALLTGAPPAGHGPPPPPAGPGRARVSPCVPRMCVHNWITTMGSADLKLVSARQWHLSTDTEPVIDRSKGFIVLYHHQILILKRREIYIHTRAVT